MVCLCGCNHQEISLTLEVLQQIHSSSNTDHDRYEDSVFADIAHTCNLVHPNKLAADVLQNLDILAHVPALQQGSQNSDLWTEGDNGGSRENYLACMSDLNQLLVMNAQLHLDVSQPHNHKYIAHQLAILYQCLSQVGGETLPFSRRIEKGFNDIKHLTEEAEPRELNEFCKEWLQDLTEGVQSVVRSFPPQLYSGVKTLTELTKRLHSIETSLWYQAANTK